MKKSSRVFLEKIKEINEDREGQDQLYIQQRDVKRRQEIITSTALIKMFEIFGEHPDTQPVFEEFVVSFVATFEETDRIMRAYKYFIEKNKRARPKRGKSG